MLKTPIVTCEGIEIIYPRWDDSIPVENKISFKLFMKICWINSRTNLHFIDFKTLYQDSMKKMFFPVKLKKGVRSEQCSI